MEMFPPLLLAFNIFARLGAHYDHHQFPKTRATVYSADLDADFALSHLKAESEIN